MKDLDRIIHEPARLRILTILSSIDVADFNFLCNTLGLTKGNLSSHMDRLEREGYVEINKTFNGKVPHTEFKLSDDGRNALQDYWAGIDAIRSMTVTEEADDVVEESGDQDEGQSNA